MIHMVCIFIWLFLTRSNITYFLEFLSHGYIFLESQNLIVQNMFFFLGGTHKGVSPSKKVILKPLTPLFAQNYPRSSVKLPYKDHSFLFGCSKRLNILSQGKMFPNKRKWKFFSNWNMYFTERRIWIKECSNFMLVKLCQSFLNISFPFFNVQSNRSTWILRNSFPIW